MKRAICILLLAGIYALAYASDGITLSTVVIDPGHGGKDPGAISKDKKTYEKTLVLDVSKKLAEKIRAAYPDVKVVLTREKDEFVSLDERASIANRADANLFISIHINSAASSSPNGYSLHLLGQSSNKNKDLFAYNMDVCKLENSVISLEDDTTKYEGFDPDDPESQIFAMLMQSAFLEQSLKFAQTVNSKMKDGPIQADRGVWQNPFYVLWKTSMPAVLIELGFISNSTDLAALRSSGNREEIATRLFNAFKEFKTSYDGNDETPVQSEKVEEKTVPEIPSEKIAQPKVEEKTPVRYGVQIFAVQRSLYPGAREFMGYKPSVFKSGTLNKYVIGIDVNLQTVENNLKEIRKKYPEAFIVKISGEELEVLKK
ncbi:MAG: N-acetylmuramoyl-L-alanine amidase [Bacteroidales bacterium]|nr:N-acetylmuramoyl-L-alanine amidase [Bacteroidales bacterium]